MPAVRQSILDKLDWNYAVDDEGPDLRFARHEGKLIVQKRVSFAENSRSRLMTKALRGEYSLTDLEIKGTGNSYLVRGWETTDLLEDSIIPDYSEAN